MILRDWDTQKGFVVDEYCKITRKKPAEQTQQELDTLWWVAYAGSDQESTLIATEITPAPKDWDETTVKISFWEISDGWFTDDEDNQGSIHFESGLLGQDFYKKVSEENDKTVEDIQEFIEDYRSIRK